MSDRNIPLLTQLVQACKRGDKSALEQLLNSIIKKGLSKDELNFADENGRTALSYIVTTSQTRVVEFLLRFKDLDINIPDNDGNTPLHFAAEAGNSDMITKMVIRRCDLLIDVQNSWGLTPLMKAAVQGQTDCATRLVMANASLSLKDTGRGFTAKDWADFCGRKICAETLGAISKRQKAVQAISHGVSMKTPIRSKVTNQQKEAKDTLKSKISADNNKKKSDKTMKQIPIIPIIIITLSDKNINPNRMKR